MSNSFFQCNNLVKSYADNLVVDGVSFAIKPGECLGVIGPNGAGKTTTLRICLGLTLPDQGNVNAFGFTMPKDALEIKARLGVVSQFDTLDPDFTCAENLRVYGNYFGIDRQTLASRIPELLEFASLGQKADSKPSELSGGMKRRLSLARALINNPDLLLLDEPTTGLDPQARHLMWERLSQLVLNGKSILLTTHFMDEAERLCHRIIVLDHGKIIAEGTPRSLLNDHLEPEVIEVFGSGAPELKNKFLATFASRVEVTGESIYFYTATANKIMEELKAYPKLRVLHRPVNLEDLFLKLTGRQIREGS
jgi:lipooligosaccharide transport system ATP-binding protein